MRGEDIEERKYWVKKILKKENINRKPLKKEYIKRNRLGGKYIKRGWYKILIDNLYL